MYFIENFHSQIAMANFLPLTYFILSRLILLCANKIIRIQNNLIFHHIYHIVSPLHAQMKYKQLLAAPQRQNTCFMNPKFPELSTIDFPRKSSSQSYLLLMMELYICVYDSFAKFLFGISWFFLRKDKKIGCMS